MEKSKELFFKRQISLSEIGISGQEKLQKSKVLVVGCGGLGSPIAVYLAMSGVGQIHLVDFDVVDITNLHRQVYFSLEDIGKPKSEVLATFIKKRTTHSKISYSNFPINKNNVFELIENVDIVVDGTDSLPTKYLLNDACVIQNKPLIYGSLYKFDGYVATFNLLQKDGGYSANLRDAFPVMATDVPNCEEAGTLNSIVGMIATQQVNEVLKIITGIGAPIVNKILIYNSLNNTQFTLALKKVYDKTMIESLFMDENYEDITCEIRNNDWLISADDLHQMIENTINKPTIISVIADKNVSYPFNLTANIPLSNTDELISFFKEHQQSKDKFVMVCHKGNSSYKAVKIIKKQFPSIDVLSLISGISSYQ